jgi:hypothetical protein
MFKNYLLIAVRNLLRQKGFSAINIIGLSVGMACSILILLWVSHELSYNRFNEKADRLYRLVQTQHYVSGPLTTTCMPGRIAQDLQKDIPEISNSFMYYVVPGIVSYGDRFFRENVRLADPALWDMFSFTFIKGDKKHAFDEVNSAVITDKFALKYFGGEDPVGKVLTFNDEHLFKVTGVIRETPSNSTFRFDVCIPFEYIRNLGFTTDDYGWNTYFSYVELAPEGCLSSFILRERREHHLCLHLLPHCRHLPRLHVPPRFQFTGRKDPFARLVQPRFHWRFGRHLLFRGHSIRQLSGLLPVVTAAGDGAEKWRF